jgi:AraC-like DNA-binding protein
MLTWCVAQKLLKRHKPVQTVAPEVGYTSQPAFIKAFTAKLGMSPRAWLNRMHRLG